MLGFRPVGIPWAPLVPYGALEIGAGLAARGHPVGTLGPNGVLWCHGGGAGLPARGHPVGALAALQWAPVVPNSAQHIAQYKMHHTFSHLAPHGLQPYRLHHTYCTT